MEDLSYIGKRRRMLGLTQAKLAKLAGVSQSLITKIEGNKTDISYSKAKRIFNVLEEIVKKEEVYAEQIMTCDVKLLKEEDSVEKAIEIMEEFKISQIPVIKNQICVGSIDEGIIVREMQTKREIRRLKVEAIMGDSFPSISPKASLNDISSLLKMNSAVLIYDKGKLKGIITKSDILRSACRI